MKQNNNIPKGYKDSPLGIIPQDWEVKRLGEIAEINPLKDKNIVGDITFITMADVSEYGTLLNQDVIKYSSVKTGFTPFQKNDILVAKITPCFENGKGALLDKLPTQFGFGSTEFHVIRSKVNEKFIFYHSRSYSFRKHLEAEMTGSAGQKRVPSNSIALYRIPLPPLPEQKKIAEILSLWDEAIEKQAQIIDLLEQRKRGLMQQLLSGKKRLNGFSGEWEKVKMGEIFISGSKEPVNDTALFTKITIKLYKQGIEYSDNSRIMADTRPFYVREKGEIIIGKQNYFNGSIAIVDKKYNGCICSNAIMSFKIIDSVNKKFVFEKISEPEYLKKREMLANGTGQKELSEKDFLNFDVLLPSFPEQNAISKIITTTDDEIKWAKQKLDSLQKQKKGLMQVLLTGKMRVKI